MVSSVDRDSVVGSEIPSLLGRSRIRLPYLGVHVVALRYTSVEREVGTGDNDRASSRVNIPLGSCPTVRSDQSDAIGGCGAGRQGQTATSSAGSNDRVGESLLNRRSDDDLIEDGKEYECSVSEHGLVLNKD